MNSQSCRIQEILRFLRPASETIVCFERILVQLCGFTVHGGQVEGCKHVHVEISCQAYQSLLALGIRK